MAPPWFVTVLVTLTFLPGAVVSGAAVAVVTRRSGPTRIGVAVAFTLFTWPGESTSGTVFVAFVRAITQ